MRAPFFAVVIAVLICDGSAGRVARNAASSSVGAAQAVAVAIAARKAVGHSAVAMLACLAASSLAFAYPAVPLLHKKVALAVSAILYLTFLHDASLGALFAAQVGGTTLIGAGCAVVAMLAPWPKLARTEVWTCRAANARCSLVAASVAQGPRPLIAALESSVLPLDRKHCLLQTATRLAHAAECLAALFATLLDAFGCVAITGDGAACAAVHASMLAKACAADLAVIKDRMADLRWELVGSVQRARLLQLHDAMDRMLLHCSGMQAALQDGDLAGTAPALVQALRKSVSTLAAWTSEGLALAATFERSSARAAEEALLCQGRYALQEFDKELHEGRLRAYYNPSAILGDEVASDGLASVVGSFAAEVTPSLVASQFLLFNIKGYSSVLLELLGKGASGRGASLHRWWEAKHRIPAPGSMPAMPSGAPAVYPEAILQPSIDIDEDDIDIQEDANEEQPDLSGQALAGSHQHVLAHELPAPALSRARAAKALGATKVALAMLIAGIIGDAFLPASGYWAPVTVGFIIGSNQGGSFKAASLRLQGTAAGSIYGYLAIKVAHHHQWLVVFALVPWVIVASFVRHSSSYGYAGVVAAFTAAVIMLGYQQSGQGVDTYSLGRITETFIGVLCFVVVEGVVWPSRAVVLVRASVVSCLQDCRDCVAAIIRAYMNGTCLQCREKFAEDAIGRSLVRQALLADEAQHEPDLWWAPFPSATHSRLQEVEGHMLRCLYFMDCSLHAASAESLHEQLEKLVRPLSQPLGLLWLETERVSGLNRNGGRAQALEAEVLVDFDLLLEVLRLQPSWRGYLTTTSGSGSCEAPVAGTEPQDAAEGRRSTRWQEAATWFWKRITRKVEDRRSVREILSQHPLLVLVKRRSSIGGFVQKRNEPLQELQTRFQDVFAGLIAVKIAHPTLQIVGNAAMLSFTALVYSLRTLLKEVRALEETVKELLQVEQPLDVVQLSYLYHVDPTTPNSRQERVCTRDSSHAPDLAKRILAFAEDVHPLLSGRGVQCPSESLLPLWRRAGHHQAAREDGQQKLCFLVQVYWARLQHELQHWNGFRSGHGLRLRQLWIVCRQRLDCCACGWQFPHPCVVEKSLKEACRWLLHLVASEQLQQGLHNTNVGHALSPGSIDPLQRQQRLQGAALDVVCVGQEQAHEHRQRHATIVLGPRPKDTRQNGGSQLPHWLRAGRHEA
eukprot:SM000132S26854  [mRNA]  locus=s132:9162:16854:+ [translate_table: standard]